MSSGVSSMSASLNSKARRRDSQKGTVKILSQIDRGGLGPALL